MMKKRIMAVLALAMMIAVLAAGTAQAGTRAPSLTLTNGTGDHSVPLNGTAAFTITETNNEPFAVDHVQVLDNLPPGVVFEKATLNIWDQNGAPLEHSQEQCTYVPPDKNTYGSVMCNIGTLPPGATAVIDVVVTPVQPGVITTNAYDSVGNSASGSVLVCPA